MASGMASLTLGDLHSITTTGRPFRNSTMSGTMWCSVPRMRTLNWQTAMKRLLSRCRKVHKTHRRALLAGLAVLADAGVFQQQLEQVVVVLQQSGAGEARRELLDHLLHLIVFQPGVDDLELLAQHRQHHDLGRSSRDRCRPGAACCPKVDDFPPQACKLIEQGFLDVVALVEAKRVM